MDRLDACLYLIWNLLLTSFSTDLLLSDVFQETCFVDWSHTSTDPHLILKKLSSTQGFHIDLICNSLCPKTSSFCKTWLHLDQHLCRRVSQCPPDTRSLKDWTEWHLCNKIHKVKRNTAVNEPTHVTVLQKQQHIYRSSFGIVYSNMFCESLWNETQIKLQPKKHPCNY